jgi:hypothetical protein
MLRLQQMPQGNCGKHFALFFLGRNHTDAAIAQYLLKAVEPAVRMLGAGVAV